MKAIFFIVSIIATINSLHAQVDSYKITKSDTIELSGLTFEKVVALHFDEAIILVDYDLFMKHLSAERKDYRSK